jgi:hypothetical protein
MTKMKIKPRNLPTVYPGSEVPERMQCETLPETAVFGGADPC